MLRKLRALLISIVRRHPRIPDILEIKRHHSLKRVRKDFNVELQSASLPPYLCQGFHIIHHSVSYHNLAWQPAENFIFEGYSLPLIVLYFQKLIGTSESSKDFFPLLNLHPQINTVNPVSDFRLLQCSLNTQQRG